MVLIKKISCGCAGIALAALLPLAVACTASVRVSVGPEPEVLHDPQCLASVLTTANNQRADTAFYLPRDTRVRIVYQGEGANSDMAPSLVETYHNDCVEFYIDTDGTDRQLRFVWGSRLLTGKSVLREGVTFAQGDPSDTEYCFEIALPWKSLGIACPGEDGSLIVDCSAIDNDAESRKTQIAWHCEDSRIYEGSGKHGTLALAGLHTPEPVEVDGMMEPLWDRCPAMPLENEILGKVRDSTDLSASFRLLWDYDAVYVFVSVRDDIKKMAEVLFDRASLCGPSGGEVWRPYLGRTFHAGGALKNRRQEDTLQLSKGRYILEYSTDESHSAGHWDDVPPAEPFSGVKIYALQ